MTKLKLAAIVVAIVLLALVPPVAQAIDEPFYLSLFARIMVSPSPRSAST